MTANTVLESTPGKMAVSTKVTGTTANSMEMVSTDRQMVPSVVAAGKRANACNGTTSRLSIQ